MSTMVTMAWDTSEDVSWAYSKKLFFLPFSWLNCYFLRTMMMMMMTNSHNHTPSSSPTPASGWVGARDMYSLADASQALSKLFFSLSFIFWLNWFHIELRMTTTATNSHHTLSSPPTPALGWLRMGAWDPTHLEPQVFFFFFTLLMII